MSAIKFRKRLTKLEKDGLVFVEEEERANVLNDFFRNQTLLNDHDAVLPEITIPG